MEAAAGQWQVGMILHFGLWPKTRGPEPISLVFLLGSSCGKAQNDRNVFSTTIKSQDTEAETGRGTS